jgi:hypothetical protein
MFTTHTCQYNPSHTDTRARTHIYAQTLAAATHMPPWHTPTPAGVALYNGVFKTVPLKRMLMGAMLLGAALSSTQLLLVSGANKSLGLSNELFVLGDSVILTVLGQV